MGKTTIESVTLSMTGAQVTGGSGEKDRLKEKAEPKSEKSRRASLGIFSILKQNQLFSHGVTTQCWLWDILQVLCY